MNVSYHLIKGDQAVKKYRAQACFSQMSYQDKFDSVRYALPKGVVKQRQIEPEVFTWYLNFLKELGFQFKMYEGEKNYTFTVPRFTSRASTLATLTAIRYLDEFATNVKWTYRAVQECPRYSFTLFQLSHWISNSLPGHSLFNMYGITSPYSTIAFPIQKKTLRERLYKDDVKTVHSIFQNTQIPAANRKEILDLLKANNYYGAINALTGIKQATEKKPQKKEKA